MTGTSTRRVPAAASIDPDRWPDIAVAAGSPVRAAVARALFTRAVARLPLRVRLPDGSASGAGGPDAPVMEVRRPADFFRRFGASRPFRVPGATSAATTTCPTTCLRCSSTRP